MKINLWGLMQEAFECSELEIMSENDFMEQTQKAEKECDETLNTLPEEYREAMYEKVIAMGCCWEGRGFRLGMKAAKALAAMLATETEESNIIPFPNIIKPDGEGA